MKRLPLEKTITKEILSWLRAHGFWAVKIHGGPFQRAGLPDIIACKKGRFFAFEVKRPGGQLTTLQRGTLMDLSNHGAVAAPVYSLDSLISNLTLLTHLEDVCGPALRQF